MTIGKRIKEKRLEKGWSLRELAERVGYANHSTIARIESGQIDISQSKIVQFSEVLGVNIAYLMGWEEVEKKADDLASIFTVLYDDEDLLSAVQALVHIKKNDPEGFKSIAVIIKGLDK